MKYLLLIIICIASYRNTAQTVINRYAAVLSQAGGCSNTFLVDDASGFGTGDTILMIQMKGAIIDSSNSSAFGTILAYNGAGNYELNVVSGVTGNNISLLYKVVRQYDIPKGKVQFVRVACYSSYTVNTTHGCKPWNGSKGGVFAIRVGGALTLNADIDVSGMGFSGGTPKNVSVYGCNRTDYYYPTSNNEGAQKGEGVAEVSAAKGWGRGALANGGGGGNDHNGGGGGGSNAGSGGIGGNQFKLGSCVTTLNIGGVGGYAMNYALNKLFLGGGGGCGQGNNLGEMAGAPGGGIIYISAGNLIGNGHSINANGADAPQCTAPSPGCQDDGGGGGGGGGVIYNTSSVVSGALIANAHGGKGSNIYVSPNTTEVAPGGGGGGGLIAFIPGSYSSSVSFNAAPGNAGVLPQFGNINYGAAAGNSGTKTNSIAIPIPSLLYNSGLLTAGFSDTLISCNTYRFINYSTSVIGILSYTWNFGGDGTSSNQNPTHLFSAAGIYTVVLTITDSNGCTASISRIINVQPVSNPSFTDSLLACSTVAFINTSPSSFLSFHWEFGTEDNSSLRSPIYKFHGPGTYTVKLSATDSNGCSASFYKNIVIRSGVHAHFNWSPVPVTKGIPVMFSNHSIGATQYKWNFGDGAQTTVGSPSHTYSQVDTLQVCLVANDDLECSDSICKRLEIEAPIAIGIPSAFTPDGDGVNDVLYVKGSGIQKMRLIIFN